VNRIADDTSVQLDPWLKVYPNPSLDKVMILCGPRDWAVEARIEILDVTGRCVRAFKGEDTISWDHLTDSGELAASGVYFITVRGRSGSRGEKLILIE
jgi:hypothetical protein